MRSINQCLNKQLAEICQRSMQLEELTLKVTQLLPANLGNHCLVGSFNKGCLTLAVSDANWASQLRYAIPELRDRLRKEAGMYQLTSIKIMVSPLQPSSNIPYTKTKTRALSEKTRTLIIKESEFCSYEPLQKALMHLAQGEKI